MDTSVQAQWLGHSAFKFVSPQGTNILVDPFLSGNPSTPDEYKQQDEIDYILLTHGHEDHVGDTLDIAEATGCKVVSQVELSRLLVSKHGLDEEQAIEFNKGGTVAFDDFSVTMVDANHSSSFQGDYAGESAGLVISFYDDITFYDLGDTNIFYELELYGELYEPDIVAVPMGDHYTMGPGEAAMACDLLQADYAVPIHYGTFPPLTGDPEDFKKYTEKSTDTEVWIPEAGDHFLA
ncbi:metal-dependent hydrolase [Fodinibius sp.]|uniref:metal-dependent hydrolase n=1 Tax=Fodinibius sp. TaxID=1872440 RepID=UPI002ACE68B9|nr:metal-dependent hydrolase [Fodinibius sp.]MDZ7657920.1 metal-dependent hydrolase [Fodinibius sp.]